MREAVGDDISLGVDAHWRFDLKTALYVAEKLRPYHPFWMETPIPEKKPELLRCFREHSGLLIAGGEMQTGAEAVLPLLEEGCLDEKRFFWKRDAIREGKLLYLPEDRRYLRADPQYLCPSDEE